MGFGITGGNDAASEKKWHAATHPIPAWPPAARGTSRFSWCRRLLAGPAVRANNSDLRAVRHAELAHDLPNMKFDGTFTHRQPARNDLVRIAIAQKFEDRSLPRC